MKYHIAKVLRCNANNMKQNISGTAYIREYYTIVYCTQKFVLLLFMILTQNHKLHIVCFSLNYLLVGVTIPALIWWEPNEM